MDQIFESNDYRMTTTEEHSVVPNKPLLYRISYHQSVDNCDRTTNCQQQESFFQVGEGVILFAYLFCLFADYGLE